MRELDREVISFEFKSARAMWTNQSKTDKISRNYPSPSNLVGIIRSIFDHRYIYPIVCKIEVLRVPKTYMEIINGRKNLTLNEDRDSDRTQLFIQAVCDVHYRVFFRWLHVKTPTPQDFRKTQNQTMDRLERLIYDSSLPNIQRINRYRAGGKFGSIIEFLPTSDLAPVVEITEDEVTPFYRFRNGKFYFEAQPFFQGVWEMSEEVIAKLSDVIISDGGGSKFFNLCDSEGV